MEITELMADLARWRYLEECLLQDMRLIDFGSGLELIFNYIWGDDGNVREDALDRVVPVTFTLSGVESLRLVGALTDAMRSDPDCIDWGLSEVARVVPFDSSVGLGLSIRWEGRRRIDIEFVKYRLASP
jgi:hypothetical protein